MHSHASVLAQIASPIARRARDRCRDPHFDEFMGGRALRAPATAREPPADLHDRFERVGAALRWARSRVTERRHRLIVAA